jgi:hypothetical protein
LEIGMSKKTTVQPSDAKAMPLEELRREIFKAKSAHRRHLVAAPVVEKLRILEEMRDFTAAMRGVREENKALVKGAWARRS